MAGNKRGSFLIGVQEVGRSNRPGLTILINNLRPFQFPQQPPADTYSDTYGRKPLDEPPVMKKSEPLPVRLFSFHSRIIFCLRYQQCCRLVRINARVVHVDEHIQRFAALRHNRRHFFDRTIWN